MKLFLVAFSFAKRQLHGAIAAARIFCDLVWSAVRGNGEENRVHTQVIRRTLDKLSGDIAHTRTKILFE